MSFNTLTLIVVLNALGLFILWEKVKSLRPQPRKKFFKSLFDSTPIEPTDQAPKSIGDDSWHIRDHDRIFFHDFEHFASGINKVLEYESPWRVQELPDTELRLPYGSEYSYYGRRYDIYHNQVRVGKLEIHASLSPVYSTKDPKVRTYFELNYVRLFDFESVLSLITVIYQSISNPDDSQEHDRERGQIRETIYDALLRVVWDTQQIPHPERDFTDVEVGRLNFCFESTASWFLKTPDERKAILESCA
ncbi:MAG: hypothetical protein FWG52_04335 [Proteobacteria bacterium]|nr:hypothetical protein [Pseudomonadota bacterium]